MGDRITAVRRERHPAKDSPGVFLGNEPAELLASLYLQQARLAVGAAREDVLAVWRQRQRNHVTCVSWKSLHWIIQSCRACQSCVALRRVLQVQRAKRQQGD